MKTIGLIGGMSWESSAEYYRIINEEVRNRLGGLHSAKCLLYSVDFDEIERMQRQNEWNKAAEVVTAAACGLEAAGADFIVICTNTIHKVADKIQAGTNIPLLHIADATSEHIISAGMKTIGLIGTQYTMEEDFYKSRLEDRGIEVVIPEKEDRVVVNSVIFKELCLGKLYEESRKAYKNIIRKLIEEGAEGIILGCTEIGLLIKQEDSPVPLFDTTVLHAKGAVDYALMP